MASPLLVAIEGPCCAGKTTLASGLREVLGADTVVIIPDYADILGGAVGMPDPDPRHLQAELVALEVLLKVEGNRFEERMQEMGRSQVVLIDRSVLTLLGHCAGLDLRGLADSPLLPSVQEVIVGDARCRWPDYVVYLDISSGEQARRNSRGKFHSDSVFMAPTFNDGFREFFKPRTWQGPSTSLKWINAELDRETIVAEAHKFIQTLLTRDSPPGRAL